MKTVDSHQLGHSDNAPSSEVTKLSPLSKLLHHTSAPLKIKPNKNIDYSKWSPSKEIAMLLLLGEII